MKKWLNKLVRVNGDLSYITNINSYGVEYVCVNVGITRIFEGGSNKLRVDSLNVQRCVFKPWSHVVSIMRGNEELELKKAIEKFLEKKNG